MSETLSILHDHCMGIIMSVTFSIPLMRLYTYQENSSPISATVLQINEIRGKCLMSLKKCIRI